MATVDRDLVLIETFRVETKRAKLEQEEWFKDIQLVLTRFLHKDGTDSDQIPSCGDWYFGIFHLK